MFLKTLQNLKYFKKVHHEGYLVSFKKYLNVVLFNNKWLLNLRKFSLEILHYL